MPSSQAFRVLRGCADSSPSTRSCKTVGFRRTRRSARERKRSHRRSRRSQKARGFSGLRGLGRAVVFIGEFFYGHVISQPRPLASCSESTPDGVRGLGKGNGTNRGFGSGAAALFLLGRKNAAAR